MTKRISSLVILSLLVFALTAMTAFAARTFEETQTRAVDPTLTRIQQYSFPDEYNVVPWDGTAMPKMALGWAAPSASPGVVLGDTWYDYQRNGSMRRMIARNDDMKKGTQRVHFVWMRLPDSNQVARKCQYRVFNPGSGEFDCDGYVPSNDLAYMGYCVLDVTNDDRGIPAGHNNPSPATGDVYQFQAWWDDAIGACDFYLTRRAPDALQEGCQIGPDKDNGFMWPSMCWQEGLDTILHVFAQESNEGINPQAIAYFRLITPHVEGVPTVWDQTNFYCVDTVNTLSHDCDCTDEGKVVIAWAANLPEPGGCDTCSTHDYWGFTQRNSDVYVQVSHDAGESWDPRINVTKYVEGEEGFRAYTDLSVLIDSRDSVHVVWNGLYWPADAETGGSVTDFRCRLFHWSGVGAKGNEINTVHDANWVMDTCAPGAWTLNASKMTISECDNKMYVLFVQYNDSNAVFPDTIVFEDCAVKGSPGGYRGRANGELYLCVSDNWGDNWDKARNLTNSRTPGCTLVAGEPIRGNCESDNWPSMVKFGTDHSGGSWPDNLVEIPPNDPYTGNYFLDIQYINDNSAGGIIQNEGWWTQNDVRWFYIGCVEPVQEANLTINPTKIGYPTWTKHGEQRNETVTLENIGNCDLNYTATKFETTPPAGWLSVAPGGGTILAGGSDPLTVGLNVGGIVNAPGTIVHLVGSLYVDWQGIGGDCPPNSNVREVVPVECWVTDTLYEPFWDTIHTACTKLIVANTGNFGKNGAGKVNLDYIDAGDCDSTAEVYLYDGSPVIGYQTGAGRADHDTAVCFSIFGTSYIDENGFIPLGDHTPTTDMGEYEVFETGKFVTNDSLIALEMIWYAPKDLPETCSFVIQCLKIYLNDTLADPPTDVRIAEAIDWDIPADSGSRNYSGFDWNLRLLWQQGSEEDEEGCQPNDMRWGGMDFLEVYKNGELLDSFPYGGYIKDNNTQVYPENGFHPDSLYLHMGNSGFTNSDTQNTDLHMVMIKIVLDELTKGDTIVIYEQKLSHWLGTYESFIAELERCKKWYEDHIKPEKPGCCNDDGKRGDVDYSGGSPNVGDLAYLVSYLFDQPAGPAPPCFDEGNLDGEGGINVGDLAYLVSYLFDQPAGPAPKPCP